MSVRLENGRYVVEFRFRSERVHKRCPLGTTKAEAQAIEAKRRREIFEARDLGVRADPPLAGVVGVWLHEKAKHQKSYQKTLRRALLLEPYIGNKKLSRIGDAAAEIIALDELSPATRNRMLCILKAAAKHAWRKNVTAENLSTQVWLLPENNARHVYLEPHQLKLLASKAETKEGAAWIMLAAYTGLRQGELYGLTPDRVRGTLIDLGINTKTGAPRIVPVAKPVQRYLKFIPWTRTKDSLDWEWRQAKKAAKLEHVRYHDLRHTMASMLINAEVDLKVVKDALGHSTMATTNRYAHLATATLQRAFARLK